MMQLWSPDHIRFMEDAAAYGNFHAQLLHHILPLLPAEGRICDAGCGLGHLALALAPYCREITACDIAESPLAVLRNKAPDHLTVLHGDIRSNVPNLPYDGMVFSFFGDPEMILSVAQRQCIGPVIVIQRASYRHRFASAGVPEHRKFDRELVDLLREKEMDYQTFPLSLEFGQPFRSRKDALLFFSLYSQGKPLSDQEIFSRLQPIDNHPEFSFYLPQIRELTLTVFHVPPKKHLFLTGEKGVGKTTLLRKLLQDREEVGGFLTVRKMENHGRVVYMLRPHQTVYGEDDLLFTCGGPVDSQRFDELGCRCLRESEGSSVILMDELGPKERDAFAFQAAVLKALDNDTPVYGVVQEGAESTFLQQVRQHPEVQLIKVTKENRDNLLHILKKHW